MSSEFEVHMPTGLLCWLEKDPPPASFPGPQAAKKSFGYPRIWKLKALKRTRKVEAEYHRKHNWMHPALPSWTTRLYNGPCPSALLHAMNVAQHGHLAHRLEYFPMWSYKRNNKSLDDIAISHGEKPLRKFLKNPHLNASWTEPCEPYWDNKQCEPGCTLQTPSVDPATHECQPQSKCHKNRHRQTHPKYLQDTSKIRPRIITHMQNASKC